MSKNLSPNGFVVANVEIVHTLYELDKFFGGGTVYLRISAAGCEFDMTRPYALDLLRKLLDKLKELDAMEESRKRFAEERAAEMIEEAEDTLPGDAVTGGLAWSAWRDISSLN